MKLAELNVITRSEEQNPHNFMIPLSNLYNYGSRHRNISSKQLTIYIHPRCQIQNFHHKLKPSQNINSCFGSSEKT